MTNNKLEHELVMAAAVRYALGRRSYIVSPIQSYLKKNWWTLEPDSQNKFLDDIKEYLANKSEFDDEYIRQTWIDLMKDLTTFTNNVSILTKAVQDKKLYFDFVDEREQDKADYEKLGEEWNDEYSFYQVGSLETDDESEFGESQPGYYVLVDDEGCVDFLRFHINDIRVDDNNITIKDAVDGSWRKLVIR